MRVCVLGAGGVFGQNFADFAFKQGIPVLGIGRSHRKQSCFSLGTAFLYKPYHLTYELDYVMAEINKFKPDVVVNFAAQGEGAASFGADNWRFYHTNCTSLVKLVAQLNCRFVQIGSSEVYGSVNKPVTEDAPVVPTTPYSASKAAFDFHLIAMHKFKGFPMNIIRPSNCYAPGQQLHRIIPKTLISGVVGRRVPLHGGGVARKSYLHAADLSDAILRVIGGPIGEVYNVGPDEPTSIREVVERCAKVLNKSFTDLVELAPERTGQDSTYWLDSTKIKRLGWRQAITWDLGLLDMLSWVERYPELQTLSTEFQMRA